MAGLDQWSPREGYLNANRILSMIYMSALCADSLLYFDNGVSRIIRQAERRKPDYYKVSLSKEECKGKTPEEIQALRIAKYEAMKGESA